MVDKISGRIIERYRKPLIAFAMLLLGLHASAFVLGLMSDPAPWVSHLVGYSHDLLGMTGALLLLVVLSEAFYQMQQADETQKTATHRFIRARLVDWFGKGTFIEDEHVIDGESFTDFKVQGHPSFVGMEDPLVDEFRRDVHFELTVYPTKVIYGIHFESSVPSVNRAVCEAVREALRLGDESGFVLDIAIPKRPEWLFLVRTIELSGDPEADLPRITTHARHFVELVGHGYELVFCPEIFRVFREQVTETRGALPA
jgi:hypothetical protein